MNFPFPYLEGQKTKGNFTIPKLNSTSSSGAGDCGRTLHAVAPPLGFQQLMENPMDDWGQPPWDSSRSENQTPMES